MNLRPFFLFSLICTSGLSLVEPVFALRPMAETAQYKSLSRLTPHVSGQPGEVVIHVSGQSSRWLGQVGRYGAIEGSGIGIVVPSNVGELEIFFRKLIDENQNVFQVRSSDLRLNKRKSRGAGAMRYMAFDRFLNVEGETFAVDGASILFRINQGKFVSFTNQTFGRIGPVEWPMIDAEEALASALNFAEGLSFSGDRVRPVGRVRAVLSPFYTERGAIQFRRVYQVSLQSEKQALWSVSVSALDSTVLATQSLLRTIGSVEADVFQRLPFSEAVSVGLRNTLVSSDTGEQRFTDETGAFDLDGTSFTAELTGPAASIRLKGRKVQSAPSSSRIHFSKSDYLSESNTYYHVQRVSNFVRSFLKSIPVEVQTEKGPLKFDFLNRPIMVNTRVADGAITGCNAWYDPMRLTLNFLEEDSQCMASAHYGDIVYHEWGHALDDALGGIQDRGFSESIGDVLAYLITRDANLAPGFVKGSMNPIRNIDGVKVYPRDRASNPHREGLIPSGAWFELSQSMSRLYGEDEGFTRTAALFLRHLVDTDTYVASYSSVIALDDDDQDLGNCTPHMCVINQAFSRRGLAPVDARCKANVEGQSVCRSNTIMVEDE